MPTHHKHIFMISKKACLLWEICLLLVCLLWVEKVLTILYCKLYERKIFLSNSNFFPNAQHHVQRPLWGARNFLLAISGLSDVLLLCLQIIFKQSVKNYFSLTCFSLLWCHAQNLTYKFAWKLIIDVKFRFSKTMRDLVRQLRRKNKLFTEK